jgi:hypothetical protein
MVASPEEKLAYHVRSGLSSVWPGIHMYNTIGVLCVFSLAPKAALQECDLASLRGVSVLRYLLLTFGGFLLICYQRLVDWRRR